MLPERIYEPVEGEIIYHYCDANAFLAICSSGKIRMSDIHSMNDFLEMHWGYSMWEEAASQLLSEIEEDFLDKIDKIIHNAGLNGVLFSSSFSKDKDVLSQWRAYANDGKGYVIGFDAKYISMLPVRALNVIYDKKEQIKELKNVVRAIYEVEKDEIEKLGEEFWMTCVAMSQDLAAFKNPAFREEQEIRVLRFVNLIKSNSSLKLVDMGGTSFGKEMKGVPVQFRIREDSPTAFIDLDFTNNGNKSSIKEVVIGPKNQVLQSSISIFLETIGIGNVIVSRSEASYR